MRKHIIIKLAASFFFKAAWKEYLQYTKIWGQFSKRSAKKDARHIQALENTKNRQHEFESVRVSIRIIRSSLLSPSMLKWDLSFLVCAGRCGFGVQHSHTYLHTLQTPLPSTVVHSASRCTARISYWVPGWPILFACPNAPFVFVGNGGGAHTGKVDGLEAEKETRGDIATGRRGESRGLFCCVHSKSPAGGAGLTICQRFSKTTCLSSAWQKESHSGGLWSSQTEVTLLIFPEYLKLLPNHLIRTLY